MTGDHREPQGALWSSAAGDAAQISARPGIDAQICIGAFRHLLFVLLLRLRETNVNWHFSASFVCCSCQASFNKCDLALFGILAANHFAGRPT